MAHALLKADGSEAGPVWTDQPEVEALEREVAAWQAKRNAREVSINWRFTTSDAHIKLKHLYPSIAD